MIDVFDRVTIVHIKICIIAVAPKKRKLKLVQRRKSYWIKRKLIIFYMIYFDSLFYVIIKLMQGKTT